MHHITRTPPNPRTRTVRVVAAALAVALVLGSATAAHAATYYNIVNTQTGRALEAGADGTVRLAARDQNNLLQQWKRTDLLHIGSDGRFQSTLTNRVLDCVSTKSPEDLIATATMGNCASSDLRNRWIHKWSTMTPTPSVPGFQLENAHSGQYLGEEFCWITCFPKPPATLYSAEWVEGAPEQLGAHAKWQFKFAGIAP